MEFSPLLSQGFDCGTCDLALRMERLQGPKQRAGIDKLALKPVGVDALAAHGLV
jgi:hypothetical protein